MAGSFGGSVVVFSGGPRPVLLDAPYNYPSALVEEAIQPEVGRLPEVQGRWAVTNNSLTGP